MQWALHALSQHPRSLQPYLMCLNEARRLLRCRVAAAAPVEAAGTFAGGVGLCCLHCLSCVAWAGKDQTSVGWKLSCSQLPCKSQHIVQPTNTRSCVRLGISTACAASRWFTLQLNTFAGHWKVLPKTTFFFFGFFSCTLWKRFGSTISVGAGYW